MSISGTYYIRTRLPHPSRFFRDFPVDAAPPSAPMPEGLHLKEYPPVEDGFFEGEMTLILEAEEDGHLTGTANGVPLVYGYCTGDHFFAVEYSAGPASWQVWARISNDNMVEGVVCLGKCGEHSGGYPNLAYGKRIS